ncbi:MAG: sodium-dependent transporter [Elusimicrobia bacterium HGW-Elusimicrobia-3]|nr:MAG: sodium-dependent transporter [Elusimicrobia bacterium HGW-Elusimicrobia-3]
MALNLTEKECAPGGDAGRGSWGSSFGFIMAAAGSAVGLGNIWGFPMQVGKGGGAVFVLLYLVCVVFVCFPILVAELALGRASARDPIGAFQVTRPGTPWWLAGALGVTAGVGILSFYSVIAGWTLAYVWYSFTGAAGQNPGAFFVAFVADGGKNVLLSFGVLVITAAIILGGVRQGIEKAAKVMMPALFLLLVLLGVRALFLPGAAEGLAYYLKPDFSEIANISVLNAALGQAFFSLSLGMGAMITYGSYLSKKTNGVKSAGWVAGLDTCVALLAGFVIFPAGFSIVGFNPAEGGPGLIFAVLPSLFAAMPGGALFGVAFFVLLSLAALTSAISLLEVPTAALVDRGWCRRKAVLLMAGLVALMAVPSVLSQGAVSWLTKVPGTGMDFLSLMATVWNNWALPIGGLLISVFVGWVWGADKAVAELQAEGNSFPGARLWVFLIRYVSPLAILFVIIMTARGMYAG